MSIDWSSYLVCSSPNIWVFDDLLSKGLLKHLNSSCDSADTDEVRSWIYFRESLTRMWPIHRNSTTEEFFEVISVVSGVRLVEQLRTARVLDRRGDMQNPHVDHVNVEHLREQYSDEVLSFLDMSQHSESMHDGPTLVPTYSLVVYLNDVGDIRFPKARGGKGVSIKGRPGRIIMFQNYIDGDRPKHSTLATHFGMYLPDHAKRLITMGVLSNQTPVKGTAAPIGLVYCPGSLDKTSNTHHCGHHEAEQDPEKLGALVLTVDGVFRGSLRGSRYRFVR